MECFLQELTFKNKSFVINEYPLSYRTNLLILIILAGDIEMNPGPNVVSAKNIARHQKNRLNVKNAKSAFTHHASVLTKRNCWN